MSVPVRPSRRPTVRRIVAALSAVTAVSAAVVTAALPAQAQPRQPHVGEGASYVALGDSYTAAPLVPPADPTAGPCARSLADYPHLVAAAIGAALSDVSCSGADTADMTGSQYPGVAPQLDALGPDTDLVTVSIGGNDESVFGTLVGYCPTLRSTDPTGTPCRDAMRADGGDRLLDAIKRTRARVDAVVAEVRQRAPQAQVVVVGYPQIAPRHGTCPALLPLADGDYRYAVQVNHRLTLALSRAAHRNHAAYVDLWRASRGHDICAADPWINGQQTDPTRALAFHPFAEEQAAVARLVVDALR